jgi:hypothetical protein
MTQRTTTGTDQEEGREVSTGTDTDVEASADLRRTATADPDTLEESADARLSRLLFEARTAVELLRDRLRSRTGEKDRWSKRLISEIDDYRSERGWSPDGFGGE